MVSHVSHVTCHMSQVTSQLLFVYFFGQSGGASRWSVCYQRGLPRLVLTAIIIFLNETYVLSIFTMALADRSAMVLVPTFRAQQ